MFGETCSLCFTSLTESLDDAEPVKRFKNSGPVSKEEGKIHVLEVFQLIAELRDAEIHLSRSNLIPMGIGVPKFL